MNMRMIAVMFVFCFGFGSVAVGANLGDILNEVTHVVAGGPESHNFHSPRRVNDGSGAPMLLHELEQSTIHNITRGNSGGNFLGNLMGHGGGFMNELATAGAIMEAGHVANEVLHGAGPIVNSLTHGGYPGGEPEYYGGGQPYGDPNHPYTVHQPRYEPHYEQPYGNPYQNPYQGGW